MAKPKTARVPDWIPPQLATLAPDAPAGDDWVHEIKFDGYRLLCWIDGDTVRLMTRNQKDWTDRFPAVARAMARLKLRHTVLDGEVGVELPDGRTSFQALQNAIRDPSVGQLQFWAFDLLFLNGTDLRARPLLERKQLLRDALAASAGVLRYSDHVVGHGREFFAQACEHHLEGIISKRASAPYRGGRGPDWLKVKCMREQEFVIGGYTEPSGARTGLGALHVGAYDGQQRLVYRGKVGTGFSDQTLRDLYRALKPLERASSPFVDPPRGAAARGSHWLEPRLVAQLRYTELTSDGRLRHPSYLGLREDKDPTEVQLERPTGADAEPAGARASASPKSGSPKSGSPKSGTTPKPASPKSGSPKSGSPALAPGAAPRTSGSPVSASPTPGPRPSRPRQHAEYAGIRLSNPDKVLYPENGVTKAELADYYEAVAEWMLPHIAARPLTLVRCPAGHTGHCFFQKHFDRKSVPPPISLVEIEEREGSELYGVLDSTPGLVSLVQLGALELHTWNSRSDRLERPDRFVIDLDPDPGVDWDAIVDAALHVRHLLEELGLRSFLKTTGGKGLHVVVPLVRRAEWEEVKAFSGGVASLLARAAPDRYTTDMSKQKRRGRILLDYLRNARGATAIEAYSTRARPGAPVAAPIHWDELADGVRPDTFNVRNMTERMKHIGEDPWKEIGAVRQSLTAPMKRSLGI